MKKHWKTYAAWIVGTEIVGAVAGLLTRSGTEIYKVSVEKPPLSPPAILFPIVWVLLYALMGFSAARVHLAPDSAARTRGLQLYLIQLAFNFFWSIIFFNMQAFGFAALWLLVLWGLILAMIMQFRRVDELAGKLQIPYLIWVTFAGDLNIGVWLLNK